MSGNGKKQVTADEAIAKAREVCVENGWTCLEPIKAESGFFNWTVWTNSGRPGCTAWVKIDKQSGAVTAKGYVPR